VTQVLGRRLGLALGALTACHPAPEDTSPGEETASEDPLACRPVALGRSEGLVTDARVIEASGLTRREGGGWWTHNDSGSGAVLFALSGNGDVEGDVTLAGVTPRDIEDVSSWTRPDGTREIVVADMGDNGKNEDRYALYRFDEPARPARGMRVDARTTEVRYDDGVSRDVEAMFIDPWDGRPWVLSKTVDGIVEVLAGQAEAVETDGFRLQTVLDFTQAPLRDHDRLVTSAEMSPDGRWLAVRTYLAVWLWPRAPGETVPQLLARDPCAVEIEGEPQGEAIGVDAEGFVTLSEGEREPLWRYAWRDAK
jgi:hypothetical protein